MKRMATRCGFENPTRCTGQGKRAEGISRMVNSKENIPVVESMRAARHSSVEAHLGYAEPDEEAHSKRYRAMASKTVVGAEKEEDGGGKMSGDELRSNSMMGMGQNPMMGINMMGMNPMMGMMVIYPIIGMNINPMGMMGMAMNPMI